MARELNDDDERELDNEAETAADCECDGVRDVIGPAAVVAWTRAERPAVARVGHAVRTAAIRGCVCCTEMRDALQL